MNGDDFGANEFTFAGDRTRITYLTEMPGPIPAEPSARLTHRSSRQRPNPAHVIFCVQAVITAPCGVPIFVSDP